MLRASRAFLSMSLVISFVPVFAEEQKTITIYAREGGRISSLNSPYWTHVKTFNSNHTIRAKKGYMFWTGSCEGSQKYLEMGVLGGGRGRFCLYKE